MQKLYTVSRVSSNPDPEDLSYDAAVIYAKKKAEEYQQDYAVYGMEAVVRYPVPTYLVEKVT